MRYYVLGKGPMPLAHVKYVLCQVVGEKYVPSESIPKWPKKVSAKELVALAS